MNVVQEQPVIQREVVYVKEKGNDPDENLGCWMWGLCFCIPLLGLFFYFKYKSDGYDRKANSALIAGIIGFAVGFIVGILS